MRKCVGKQRHPDREHAVAHRRSLVAAGKARMAVTKVYRCDQCGTWHVGRTGPTKRRRK